MVTENINRFYNICLKLKKKKSVRNELMAANVIQYMCVQTTSKL